MLKQIHGEVFRQIAAWRSAIATRIARVNYAADGALEISSKDGESVRITVDEKTGPSREAGLSAVARRGWNAVEEIFSDWRDVDGIRLPFQWSVMQGGKKFAGVTVQDYKINSGLTAETLGKKPAIRRRPVRRNPPARSAMTRIVFCVLAAALQLRAETPEQRGKRVVNECLQALGGDRYLNMQNRVETGRAYSFYRESLTGLSIAKIYTRYDSGVTDTAHNLAQHERDNFGKKEDYGALFTDKEAWDITFRGARPLPADRFARYKDTTLRDIFYIMRIRLHEPGWIIESKGADVIENPPVEIVDLTDADNRHHHGLFRSDHQAAGAAGFLPARPRHQGQKRRGHAFYEVSRCRDGIQWPFAIERDRNGEKIYEIFSTSVEIER